MSNIIKLPGPKSRHRKRVRARLIEQHFDELCVRMKSEADFSDIKTEQNALALRENDPFRYMKYLAANMGVA